MASKYKCPHCEEEFGPGIVVGDTIEKSCGCDPEKPVTAGELRDVFAKLFSVAAEMKKEREEVPGDE